MRDSWILPCCMLDFEGWKFSFEFEFEICAILASGEHDSLDTVDIDGFDCFLDTSRFFFSSASFDINENNNQ